jgi:hypothetical protein
MQHNVVKHSSESRKDYSLGKRIPKKSVDKLSQPTLEACSIEADFGPKSLPSLVAVPSRDNSFRVAFHLAIRPVLFEAGSLCRFAHTI